MDERLMRIRRAAMDGVSATDADAAYIIEAPLPAVMEIARDVKRSFFGDNVSFCAITNARSGQCGEDCAFCAQSAHADTDAPVYGFRDVSAILDEAGQMKRAGVGRFSVVTSGHSPTDEEFELILEAVRGIAALGMTADVSVGILPAGRLAALKRAGAATCHHNLETARSFFPEICTTHDYEDDVETVRNALRAGMQVCSGGIFGLGESWEQRVELARTLSDLNVDSVPVNFLTPVAGTKLGHRPVMPPEEALRIVALYRLLLPRTHIRVCGGRLAVFGKTEPLAVLDAGASGVMTGNYLTTGGYSAPDDVDAARGKG